MGPLDRSIDALFNRPPDQGLSLALVVMRGGEVVAERYGTQPANPFQPEIAIDAESTLGSWSMAKSITHAAVGLLVADGALDLDSPAPVPEWDGTEKAPITTLQLLEMRPGLEFIEEYEEGTPSHCIEMLFGDSGPSHAAYAAALPLVAEPGTTWNYSSGTSNIIARVVGDVVHGSPGGDPAARRAAMTDFLRERLFAPCGMDSATPKFDDAGDFIGSSFVFATARDFATFGELYRHDGVTPGGERILPVGWSDHAGVQVAVDPDTGAGYGRHWWLWPEFPGSLSCRGYEGQRIVVAADRELVLVHLGKTDVDVAPAMDERLAAVVRSA